MHLRHLLGQRIVIHKMIMLIRPFDMVAVKHYLQWTDCTHSLS